MTALGYRRGFVSLNIKVGQQVGTPADRLAYALRPLYQEAAMTLPGPPILQFSQTANSLGTGIVKKGVIKGHGTTLAPAVESPAAGP